MQSDFLKYMRYTIKLYEKMTAQVCQNYDLSRTEVDILAFLANNPGKDTARDIVELRMIPKANVSQAVETLIQKEFLKRRPDREDRRIVHLEITKKATNIVDDIIWAQNKFFKTLFEGFTDEEKRLYAELNFKMFKNIEKYL